jgi:hypothetical protein
MLFVCSDRHNAAVPGAPDRRSGCYHGGEVSLLEYKPAALSKSLLSVLLIAIACATYIFSAAPVLQLMTSRSTASGSTTTPPGWTAIYRPVTWLMSSTPLRKPLFAWSDRWVARKTMAEAVDGPWVAVGGTTTSTLRTSFSCVFVVYEDDFEDSADPATAEIPDPASVEP